MVHRRRNRSRENERNSDKWYEAREQEREADGYDSEPEEQVVDMFTYIRQTVDLIAATNNPEIRIDLISGILRAFLNNQEFMHKSGESAYKRFTGVVQMKCAEFAAHPIAQNKPDFQELVQQVAAAYR